MRCPICKSKIDSSRENRFRPFCSERCRMIDLGLWAGESYRIPDENREDSQAPPSEAGQPADGAKAGRDKKIFH